MATSLPLRTCALFLTAFALFAAGFSCRHTPTAPFVTGCQSDRDCKLDRVCERGQCTWPPERKPVIVLDGGTTAVETADAGIAVDAVVLPMAVGNRRRSPNPLPLKTPTVLWTHRTKGPIFGAPLLLPDGATAVGSHDSALHIVDPVGSPRWSFATGDLIFATPVLGVTGSLYIGSGDDHLYAIDLNTLSLAWRTKLGTCRASRGVGPEQSRCDVDGGPTVGRDGTLYVGGDGLFALFPNGKVRWHFPTGGRVSTAPAILENGTIVFGSLDDLFYAVSPDGQKLWDFRTSGDIESSPALTDDGSLVFGSDDQKIYALSQDGALRWAFSTGGEVRASPAIGRDGNVLVGSFDGLFYSIRPDGVLNWSFRTGDRIASSATVDSEGAMVFGSQDDRLYALEPNGQLRWSVELGGDVDSSPTLGPDGTIYVGSDDHNLYALRSLD